MLRLIAVLSIALSVTASADPVDAKTSNVQPFIGVSAGGGAVTSRHPLLNAFFAAPMFGLNAGIQYRKIFIFSGEVSSVSKFVAQNKDGTGVYSPASGAACTSCSSGAGGGFYSGEATFPSVGPRIDFSPLGETSPYVSVAGGFVFTQGAIGSQNGAYLTGRVGFRYRFVPRIEALVEGGYQAEWFPTSTLKNVFGNVMIRAYF